MKKRSEVKTFHQFILYLVLIIIKRAHYRGQDSFGNRYYEVAAKRAEKSQRFVLYGKCKDPSTVTPDWFNWLHYSTDTYPKKAAFKSFSWQKKPLPNLTGTLFAYRPEAEISLAYAKKLYTPWKPNYEKK